jgi:hypothetical protein
MGSQLIIRLVNIILIVIGIMATFDSFVIVDMLIIINRHLATAFTDKDSG